MKKLLLAALSCVAGTAQGAVRTDIRCFASDDARPIRFELRLYHDDAVAWSGGAVRYAGARGSIPLVLEREESEESVPGRPDQITATWREMVDGKPNGRYEMISQGARVYAMAYIRDRDGKRTPFSWAPDIDADEEKGCHW